MWRRHQAVQNSVQRLLLMRGHYPRTSVVGNHPHLLSTLRCFGGALSHAATDKLFLHKPSLRSAPSHTRFEYVNQSISDSLLISCHTFSTRRPRVPRMRDLHSVEEVIITAYEYLDVMSRRDISAVWARIALLMTKRQPKQRGKSSKDIEKTSSKDMEHMLYTIFDNTTDGIEDCGVRELTETTLGMAKIVKILRQQGKRRGEDSSRVILRRLLLNENTKPNIDLFKFLANASMNRLHQFDGRYLSNLAYACALIEYVPEFDEGSDLFDHIAMEAVDIRKEFNEQDISNMVWAYATVNKPHDALFEAMGDEVVASKHLKEFRPQALSNPVWAYATAGINHPRLFEAVANHIVQSDHLDRFAPQNFANIVWAYATAGINHPKLFEKIANHIVQSDIINRFNPQELSNTVWAYATAGINCPKLFEKIANHIAHSDHLNRFEPQALSNTMWAYAIAGINHPKLFEKVANHIVESDNMDRFKPQQLSNIVWAYAIAGIHHPRLFETAANHIVQSDIINRFKSQDFSNTVWAYATAGIHHPKLFEKIANHIVESGNLDRFKTQELSNTVWAYATAQVSHPKLFQKIAKAATQRTDDFDSQGVANLLWAYATMGITDKQLFESFVPTATKLVESFNSQGFANIAWAYAVADVNAPTHDVFINKCVEKKGGFEVEALSQLYQWHLWRTKERCNPGLPLDLLERCYEAFLSTVPRASKLQDDVVSQLTSIDLDPQEEVLLSSGYRIDALVEANGKTIGVEVDGPSHFIGKSRSPLGKTILKRRQVPAIDGIELVSVPYWEWNKLGKCQTKKQEYLRKLLGLAEDN